MSAPQKIQRGAFIVFEGLDGVGKSTQINLLDQYLSDLDIPHKLIAFPNRVTSIGRICHRHLSANNLDEEDQKRGKLDDRAVHLLFSANRWEMRSEILSDIKKGITVICDRYAYSGYAYSAWKNNNNHKENGNEVMPAEWLRSVDSGLPCPDLVVYMDVKSANDVHCNGERKGKNVEIYEKKDIQEAVKFIFDNELFDEEYWYRVDSKRDVESVSYDICTHVYNVIEDVKRYGDDISTLW